VNVLDGLVGAIQLAAKDATPEFKPIIEATVEWAWGKIADESDWWFLRQAKPLTVAIPSGKREVTLTNKDVGRLLFMSDENEVQNADYLDWPEFNHYARDTMRENANGNPTLFTVKGMVEGKKQLLFDRAPGEAFTCYLHYNEIGSLDNIERVPTSGIPTILHLAKSMLVPPEKTAADRWVAFAYKEYEMYEKTLAAWRGQSQPVVFNKHLPELDGLTDLRMREMEEY
jgi:hypothetical protein